MKPKNVSTAPAAANADASDELLVDDERTDRAEHHAAENGATRQHLKTVIEHAHLAELVEPDRRGVRSGRPQRVVDLQLAPGRNVGISARIIAGAWLFGVSWNA